MLLERSELMIREGMEEAFAAAMAERGLPVLSDVPGVRSVQMGRGVENPRKFLLLVEWDSLDDHTAFRDLPIYPEFRALLGPYSEGGVMEHFEMR